MSNIHQSKHITCFLAIMSVFYLASCASRTAVDDLIFDTIGDQGSPYVPKTIGETPFCQATRPVTAELGLSIGRSLECVNMEYNDTGNFGNVNNVVESSFLNACFAGLTRYQSEVETVERQLGTIKSSIKANLDIDQSGMVDLTQYGIVPSMYQLYDIQGSPKATIQINFHDPVVRSVRDLGYTLAQLERNPATDATVRTSIRRCITQLCGEETVYTSNIVSARPEAIITLKRGAAGRIRPTESGVEVKIARSGASFIIRPATRLNLAAEVRQSRDVMIAHDACSGSRTRILGRDRGPGPKGNGRQCETRARRGIKTTYHGCGRDGDRTIICKFTIVSPDYDQDIEFYVANSSGMGSTFTDNTGAPHTASWMRLANIETERVARTTLIADQPTELVLQYDNIPLRVESISRLTLRLRAKSYINVEFENLDILDDAVFPTCSLSR